MTIKLITFKTTQTILGKLEETALEYIVKEPVQVIVQPTKDGPMMGSHHSWNTHKSLKLVLDLQRQIFFALQLQL